MNWPGSINIGQFVRSTGVETAQVAGDVEGVVDELAGPVTDIVVSALMAGFTSTTHIRSWVSC